MIRVLGEAAPSSLILFTVMTEAIRSFETLVRSIATRYHISEEHVLHSHRRENLKSYNSLHYLVLDTAYNSVLGPKQTNKQTSWPSVCKRNMMRGKFTV
jgi:hypothetical protein